MMCSFFKTCLITLFLILMLAARSSLNAQNANPTLTGFRFDNSYGLMALTFDQLVLASTIDVSKISLVSGQPRPGVTLDVFTFPMVFNNISLQGNTSAPFFYLSTDDYARMRFQYPDIGTTKNKTYIQLDSGAFHNFYGVPSASTDGFRATVHAPDTLNPYVLSWSLDMNLGYMTIAYSEPMQGIGTSGLEFGLSGLGVQSVAHLESIVGSNRYVALISNTEQALISATSYNRVITLDIGPENLNLIKKGGIIGLDRDSSYLSLLKPNIKDSSGNDVSTTGLDYINAMPVTDYQADISSPVLWDWDFDVYSGRIKLYFSEVIIATSFNYSAVQIMSTRRPGATRRSIRFDDPNSYREKQVIDSDLFVIRLSALLYATILRTKLLLTGTSDSFLSIDAGVAWDTSLSQNRYDDPSTSSNFSRPIRTYIPDTVRPNVISVQLDMTRQLLIFSFDKLVKSSTIVLSALTLQSSVDGSDESLRMSSDMGSVIIPSNDTDTARIIFSRLAFSTLKASTALCRRLPNSYIAVTLDFIVDNAFVPNRVNAIPTGNALQVVAYTPDRTQPFLSSWFADMNENRITLVFSEPLDMNTFTVSDIKLYSDMAITFTSTYTTRLWEATVYNVVRNVVVLQLSSAESIAVKSLSPMCTQRSACVLGHSAALGRDTATFDNNRVAVTNIIIPTSAQMSDGNFKADVTGPLLLSYSVDMNLGEIKLQFDEPVNSAGADTSAVDFYQDVHLAHKVSITQSTFLYNSVGVGITIKLSTLDFLNLKLAGIATDINYVYMHLDSAFIADVAGNACNGSVKPYQKVASPLQTVLIKKPSAIIKDTKPASIIGIYRYQTNQNLTIFFDDIVDIESVNLGAFYIYNPSTASKLSLLNAILTTQESGARIDINLSPLWRKLVLSDIAQSQVGCNIYLASASAYLDVPNGNANLVLPSSQAIGEGQQLRYFRFDMENKRLLIDLVMPIDWGSWLPNKVQVYSKSNMYSFPLTRRESIGFLDGNMTLSISLNALTLGDLTSSMPIVDPATVLLLVSRDALTDGKGLQLGAAYSLPCLQILIDTTAPEVSSFDLNLDSGIMNIYFSKPITTSTVSLGALTLINSRSSITTQINLRTATLVVRSPVQTTIAINLNGGAYPTLRDLIHQSQTIGVTVSQTLLIIDKGFVADTKSPPQYMRAVAAQDAIVPSFIIPDSTAPRVTNWALDMTKRILNVTFDEAVQHSTNFASYYLLLRDPNDPLSAQQYLLTSYTEQNVGNTITMVISSTDINAINIQQRQLCYDAETCYLSIKQKSIRDISTNANQCAGILFKYSTKINRYIPDILPPQLMQFNFSLQTGQMWMHFDEIIDCSLVDMSKFMLQYSQFLGVSTQYYNLFTSAPDCTFFTGQFTTDIYIFLDNSDLMGIKATVSLMKTKTSTWISKGGGAITDIYGNQKEDIMDGAALQVTKFTPDTVRPNLISYTITSAKLLVLFFDEPVMTTSLVPSLMRFQSSLPPYTNGYFIPSATLYNFDIYKMQIRIALNTEYARITADSAIFSAQTKTFLSMSSATLTDTSGNALIGIPETLAKPLGPCVVAWDLYLDTAKIRLEFSEAVVGGFTVSGLQVQSDTTRVSSTMVLTLTSSDPLVSVNAANTLFEATLNKQDINRLKYFKFVFSKSRANLHVPYGLTTSTVAATLIPFLKTVEVTTIFALQVRNIYEDKTPPAILSFAINFNTAKLSLVFDEPVLSSSLEPTSLTAISSSGASSAILTGAMNVSVSNMTTLTIDLLRKDLNNLKLAESRGHLDTLVVGLNAVEDYFGNFFPGNTELNPIAESGGVADSTPPVLLYVDFNVKVGVLTLNFDEVVDVTTILPARITLMSTNDPNTAASLSLSRYSVIETTQDGGVTFDMQTFRQDWARLNELGGIGTSISNVFVKCQDIGDLFGNILLSTSAMQATTFTPDVSHPELVAFIIRPSASNYRLGMTFNKFVNVSSFSCADIKLSDAATAISGPYVRLAKSDCTKLTSNALADTIDVSLSANFFAAFSGGASSVKWLDVATQTVTIDAYGNLLSPLAEPISMGPRVRSWFIDMNTGVVSFIFSSTVVVSGTFNSADLGFYSKTSNHSIFLQTSPTHLSPLFSDSPLNDIIGRLTLSTADLNRVKEIDVDLRSIYLLVKNNMLMTTESLYISHLTPSDMKGPIKFTADNVRPILVSSTLNLGEGYFRMVFNEPIRASSVRVQQISIQSTASSLANSLLLGNPLATPDSTGNELNIELAKGDIATLVLRANLAKGVSSTFFSFGSGTAADYAGNTLPAISSSNGRQLTTFVVDVIPPVLSSFDLNMDLNIITLHFSEVVRVSSVTPTTLTLMARASSLDGTSLRLTGGTVLDPDGSDIRIRLTDVDVFSLKNSTGLVRNSASSFLLATASLAVDMIGNPFVEIFDTRAQSVALFIPDQTSPVITSIHMDVNEGTITFFTNELTWLANVDARGVTFQDAQLNPKRRYTLTFMSKLRNPSMKLFSDRVTLDIAANDLDVIKFNTPLLYDKSASYIAVEPSLLTDVYGNLVTRINPVNARQVDVLIKDTTPPALTQFSADMSNGALELTWDESIKFGSIDVSQVTLQTHQRRSYGFSIALSDCIAASDVGIASKVVTITLSADTMAYMKVNGICKTVFTCYLSWTDQFLSDQFNNFAIPVWDASIAGFFPILTNKVYDKSRVHVGYMFMPDTISPTLMRWLLDRATNQVFLLFDEPVSVLNMTLTTVYSSKSLQNPMLLGPLVESVTLSELSRKVVLSLHTKTCSESVTTQCMPTQFQSVMQFSAAGSFYLSMKEGAVQDLASTVHPNNMIEALPNFALREAAPNCDPCPSNFYVREYCTKSSDRVCESCTSCPEGKYTAEACSVNTDVKCAICTPCNAGQYISTACSGARNTKCSTCSLCAEDEYVIQECTMGLDTTCGSCQTCVLPSDAALAICIAKGTYNTWYEQNCCVDLDGVQVPCGLRDLNNIKIAARKARHHWVFPDPTVDMVKYGPGNNF